MKHQFETEVESRRTAMIAMGIGLGAGLILGWIIDDLAFGSLMGILVGLAFGGRDLAPMRFSPNSLRNMILSGLLIVLSLFLMIRVNKLDLNPPQQYLVALIPLIPSAIFAYAVARAIASLDELQRRIQLEAIAIGFGGTMVFVTAYGMLGQAGVVQANWGFVTLVMAGFWALGKIWTLWKYR
jgi:hypothetical protein